MGKSNYITLHLLCDAERQHELFYLSARHLEKHCVRIIKAIFFSAFCMCSIFDVIIRRLLTSVPLIGRKQRIKYFNSLHCCLMLMSRQSHRCFCQHNTGTVSTSISFNGAPPVVIRSQRIIVLLYVVVINFLFSASIATFRDIFQLRLIIDKCGYIAILSCKCAMN